MQNTQSLSPAEIVFQSFIEEFNLYQLTKDEPIKLIEHGKLADTIFFGAFRSNEKNNLFISEAKSIVKNCALPLTIKLERVWYTNNARLSVFAVRFVDVPNTIVERNPITSNLKSLI